MSVDFHSSCILHENRVLYHMLSITRTEVKLQYRFSILCCGHKQNRRAVWDREKVEERGRIEGGVSSQLIAASVPHLYFSIVAYGRPKTIHTALILIEKLVNCTQMLVMEGREIWILWKRY
jgi:hypothetical protein